MKSAIIVKEIKVFKDSKIDLKIFLNKIFLFKYFFFTFSIIHFLNKFNNKIISK